MKSLKVSLVVCIVLALQGCGENEQGNALDYNTSNKSKKQTRNGNSAHLMHVEQLNLSGQGIDIGIVETGAVFANHIEFTPKRVKIVDKINDDFKIKYHATHVAGTIGGNGLYTIKYKKWYFDENGIPQSSKEEIYKTKGMAPNSKLYSYYYQKNDSNYNALAETLKRLAKNNIYLSNHSYHHMNTTPKGRYTKDSLNIDKTISENPYILCFKAAGNDRTSLDQYRTTRSEANAKNIFTIGAITDNKKIWPPFTKVVDTNIVDGNGSSVGPTLYGAIKPDLVANGTFLMSASYPEQKRSILYPDNHKNDIKYSYGLATGTSMAAPSATGVAALLIEQYEKTNHTQKIRADELKAILVNTAEDLCNKGPDYECGFGLINAKAAADVIKTMDTGVKSLVHKDESVREDETNSYLFKISKNNTEFKATLSWIDPAPSNLTLDNMLVNDLDMWIENNNGQIIAEPFILDKNNPKKLATTGKNRVDNTEQIVVKLDAGTYKLVVKGEKIPNGKEQKYALVTKENIPAILIPKSINTGEYIWVGNGSIISHHNSTHKDLINYMSGEYPYGTTKDITQTHSKFTINNKTFTNVKQVGFFQWQVSRECKRLKIDYTGTSKLIDITVGRWSPRTNDITYKNVKLPFVIGTKNIGDSFNYDGRDWYVIGVTFNDKNIQANKVLMATCTNDNETDFKGTKLYNQPIMIQDHKWNGNASIISDYFNNYFDSINTDKHDWPYGIFRDVTMIHPDGYKPVVFFQWMSGDVCEELMIDVRQKDGQDYPYEFKNVHLSVKNWNDNKYTTDTSCTTLPCSITASTRWSVIKVAFDKPVALQGRVHAFCSDLFVK